jgi:hypothetical protein
MLVGIRRAFCFGAGLGVAGMFRVGRLHGMFGADGGGSGSGAGGSNNAGGNGNSTSDGAVNNTGQTGSGQSSSTANSRGTGTGTGSGNGQTVQIVEGQDVLTLTPEQQVVYNRILQARLARNKTEGQQELDALKKERMPALESRLGTLSSFVNNQIDGVIGGWSAMAREGDPGKENVEERAKWVERMQAKYPELKSANGIVLGGVAGNGSGTPQPGQGSVVSDPAKAYIKKVGYVGPPT